ncbi:DUF6538 domain-containing protein [Nostoc sp. NIES-2111]
MPKLRLHNQHLKQRGSKWYLVVRVPKDVALVTGQTLIQEALKTSNVLEARRLRDVRIASLEREWHGLRLKLAEAPRYLDEETIKQALRISREPNKALRQEAANDLAMEVYDEDVGEVEDYEYAPSSEAAAAAYRLATGTVSDLATAGERYLIDSDLKVRTAILYRGVFKMAAKTLPGIDEIDREKAKEYLRAIAKTGSLSRLKTHSTALKSLWRYLERDEAVWVIPQVKVAKETVERGPFSDAEVLKLIDAAPIRMRRAIRIGAFTGLRQEEIASINYDAEKDQLLVKAGKTEAARRRVPCPDAIREDVKAWVKDRLKPQSIANIFLRVRAEAEVPAQIEVDGKPVNRTFHSLRHGFVTKAIELGVPDEDIKRVVGHKSRDITQGTYARFTDPERHREWINRITYG